MIYLWITEEPEIVSNATRRTHLKQANKTLDLHWLQIIFYKPNMQQQNSFMYMHP